MSFFLVGTLQQTDNAKIGDGSAEFEVHAPVKYAEEYDFQQGVKER